jgi:hypothetical protein
VDQETDLVFLFEGIKILDGEFPDHLDTYETDICNLLDKLT